MGETVTFLFHCDNCGYEENLASLQKAVVNYKFDNDIWKTKANHSLEEESYEYEFEDEDSYRSYESYHATCPKCGYKEEWYYDYISKYPLMYLRQRMGYRRRYS